MGLSRLTLEWRLFWVLWLCAIISNREEIRQIFGLFYTMHLHRVEIDFKR